MGRHEAGHFKRIQRQQSGKVFLGRRGMHLLVSLLAMAVALPVVVWALFAVFQYSYFSSLAGTTAHEHAKAAVGLIDPADISAGEEGAKRIADRLDPLFALSGCEGCGGVAWGVYTASGTQGSMVAGTSTITPAPYDILTARSSGSSVDSKDMACSALAIIQQDGKIVGFLQVTVDFSAYIEVLRRAVVDLALLLAAAIGVFLLVFLALGFFSRFREADFEPPRTHVGVKGVLGGYGRRAACLALFVAVISFVGTLVLDAHSREIFNAEHEKMVIQNAALNSAMFSYVHGGDLDAVADAAANIRFECHGVQYSFRLLRAGDGVEYGGIMQALDGKGAVVADKGRVMAWVPVYGGQGVAAVLQLASEDMRGSLGIPLAIALSLAAAVGAALIYLVGVSSHDRHIARDMESASQAALVAIPRRSSVRNPMFPRFVIAAAVAVVAMVLLGMMQLYTIDAAAPPDGSAAGAAICAALESVPTEDTEAELYKAGAKYVTLTYSASPDGSKIIRTVDARSSDAINAITPQNVEGYNFCWLLDGEKWDGRTVEDGMSLTGAWIPVYVIQVY